MIKGSALDNERLKQGNNLFVKDYFDDLFTSMKHSVRMPPTDLALSSDETRKVLKHMKQSWGAERATRKYLYQLFPHGYGQQACKIAGMRKPLKLMLDV